MTRTRRLTVLAAFAAVLGAAAVDAGPLDAPGYSKAFSCSACHGPAGNSRSDAMPILAGMNRDYLKKAIEDYASGKRVSAEMEPFAKQVKTLGVDDVAAYFAAQAKQPSPIKADRAAAARGREAAAACAGCHGPDGKGDPAKLIPDLTGQPPAYLRNQMMLFKTDKRSPGDEPLKAMKQIMKTIPDERLADIAAYYSSLR
jgi:cytochrome c553